MVGSDLLCLNTINKRVDMIRQVFHWGVSEEMVLETVHRALLTVKRLEKGKTKDVCINESKKGNTGVAGKFTDNKSGEEIFRWQNLWSVETQDDEGVVGNSLYWLKQDMAEVV